MGDANEIAAIKRDANAMKGMAALTMGPPLLERTLQVIENMEKRLTALETKK